MRRFKMSVVSLLPFVTLAVGLVPMTAVTASAAEPAVTAPPLAARTLSQGYYLLAVSPKTFNGRAVSVKAAFLFPSVVGMKGEALVIGGKNSPQMRGTVHGGQVSATTNVGGGSFAITGPVAYIEGQSRGSTASGTFTWTTTAGNRVTGSYVMVPVNSLGAKLSSALTQTRNGIGTTAGLGGQEFGYQGPGLFSNLETANLGGVGGAYSSKDPTLATFGSGTKGTTGSSSTDSRSSYQKAKDALDYGSGKGGGTGTAPATDKPAPSDEGVIAGAIAEAKKEWNESDTKKWIDEHTGGGGTGGKESGDDRPTYGSGGLNTGGTPGAGGDKGGNGPGPGTGSTGGSGGVNGANGATINRVGNGGDNPFEVPPADVLNASHLFDGSKDPPPGVAGSVAASAAIKR